MEKGRTWTAIALILSMVIVCVVVAGLLLTLLPPGEHTTKAENFTAAVYCFSVGAGLSFVRFIIVLLSGKTAHPLLFS